MKDQNLSQQRRIRLFSYFFSVLAALMSVYSIFFSNSGNLQQQGIYWFSIAVICALLPQVLPLVTKLKISDFEIEFKKKLTDIERRVAKIEDIFAESFEHLKQSERKMPLILKEQRSQYWDNYDEFVKNLDKEQRFELQKKNSLLYLRKFGLTVHDLKEGLAKLGYYKGSIDDEFSEDLVAAIEYFQRVNNMRYVDGIFGELTLEKITQQLNEITE